MNKDLISVVVPIYNVEKYLEECIDSILSQTYENLEILLIDDGSTDSSGNIAENYMNKSEKIKTFHKKNGGLSDARNYGINHACGKYICFIDSDDYVKEDYITTMYENLKKFNTKISACGICYLYGDQKIKEVNFQNIKKLYLGEEAQIYLNIIGFYNVSSCNKLFDINLFKNINFPRGLKSEDWYIMYKLIELSGAIYYDSNSKYVYRQRDGSITKSSTANIDSIKAAETVYQHFINNANVKKYAAQALAFAIIGVYNHSLRQKKYQDLSKLTRKFKKIYKDITYSKLPFARKIQLFLFNYFQKLYNEMFKFIILQKKRGI